MGQPEREGLPQFRGGVVLVELVLGRPQAGHHVAEVMGHARGQPAHGADPLEVEQRLLLALHLLEGRPEHLAPLREQGDQPLDDAPLRHLAAGLLDGLEDVGRLPGLPQEAEGVGAVDGRLEGVHVGVPGQDDAGHVRTQAAELLEQVHAGHPRHPLVGDHHVERRFSARASASAPEAAV